MADKPEVHLPPSQMAPPWGPVPKGGEPVVWTKGNFAPPKKVEEEGPKAPTAVERAKAYATTVKGRKP